MITLRSRARNRLLAVAATSALVAGTLAVTATSASASEETIDNATFTWGVSGYAQDGIFGPWRFTDFTGDASYLEGNVAVSPANPDPQTEYAVDPFPATSFPTSKAGKAPNAVRFTGGEGTIDRATGAAELEWTGSYTVNAYPDGFNAPDEIYSDPELEVNADGSGTLTADFTIGAGVDSAGDPFSAQSFGRLTIATFDAGSVTGKSIRGYRVTPDFQGVTNGLPGQTTTCTEPSVWGSWPAAYIDALNGHESGRSVLPHFYTTGCGGKQDNKPALPFDVTFPTDQGEVSLSQTVFDNDELQTVTVTGEGFNPHLAAGNTQPPFAGKSSGVYIAFGRFQDVWDPAAGAPGGNRALADDTANRNGVSVKWAVPAGSFPGNPAQDPNTASYTELKADGSFTAELKIKKSWISAATGNWGIYTYRGGNAAVTEYATFTPITFVDKAEADVELDKAAYTGTTGNAIPVEVDVTGTAGTATGDVSLSFDPQGAEPSEVVDTAPLAGGSATLEVPAFASAAAGTLSASYTGDDAYLAATSDTATLDITEPISTEVSLDVDAPASTPYGTNRTATVTVDPGDGGGPVPTGTVTAKIGSSVVGTADLDDAGVAEIAIRNNVQPGTNRKIDYSYAGDDNYDPATAQKPMTFTKATVTITDKVTKTPTTKKSGSITITLTGKDGVVLKPTGKVKVYFKKSGQKTVATGTGTLKNGVRSLTAKKLKKKGTWKIYVKYYAGTGFASVSSKYVGTVKVTK